MATHQTTGLGKVQERHNRIFFGRKCCEKPPAMQQVLGAHGKYKWPDKPTSTKSWSGAPEHPVRRMVQRMDLWIAGRGIDWYSLKEAEWDAV